MNLWDYMVERGWDREIAKIGFYSYLYGSENPYHKKAYEDVTEVLKDHPEEFRKIIGSAGGRMA